MLRFFILLVFAAGITHVAGQDVDSVLSEIRSTYDRIETFSADATIYEYFG